MAQNNPPYTFPNQVVESAGGREAWLRRPDESKRAFEAFEIWLHLEKRSLTEVGQKLSPKCTKANVSRWSTRHLWQARGFEWDLHQEELQRQQLARGRIDMRNRHLKIGMAMQQIASHALLELQAKIASGTPLNMSPEEVKAIMDLGVKLERQAIGAEKEHRFTKINVILGTHRYPGEPCGCKCPACASCHGAEGEAFEESPVVDADEPKKLN